MLTTSGSPSMQISPSLSSGDLIASTATATPALGAGPAACGTPGGPPASFADLLAPATPAGPAAPAPSAPAGDSTAVTLRLPNALTASLPTTLALPSPAPRLPAAPSLALVSTPTLVLELPPATPLASVPPSAPATEFVTAVPSPLILVDENTSGLAAPAEDGLARNDSPAAPVASPVVPAAAIIGASAAPEAPSVAPAEFGVRLGRQVRAGLSLHPHFAARPDLSPTDPVSEAAPADAPAGDEVEDASAKEESRPEDNSFAGAANTKLLAVTASFALATPPPAPIPCTSIPLSVSAETTPAGPALADVAAAADEVPSVSSPEVFRSARSSRSTQTLAATTDFAPTLSPAAVDSAPPANAPAPVPAPVGGEPAPFAAPALDAAPPSEVSGRASSFGEGEDGAAFSTRASAEATAIGKSGAALNTVPPMEAQMSSRAPLPENPPANIGQNPAAAATPMAANSPAASVSASVVLASTAAPREKIAPTEVPARGPSLNRANEGTVKKFLTVDEKVETKASPVDGIAIAKTVSSMPTNPDARDAAAPVIQEVPALSSPALVTGETASSREASVSVPVISESRLAAVVHEISAAVDRVGQGEKSSVDLRFEFSGHDRLAVRVEWRGGVVHTTFRTESPELRESLATAWLDNRAAPSDKPYRFAEPVFSGGPTTPGFSAQAGGEFARQRQPAPEAPAGFNPASGLGARAAKNFAADTAAPLPALSRPDTALHLHAFA